MFFTAEANSEDAVLPDAAVLCHSALSASIGFSLLARRAGAQPKTIPTASEKPRPSMIADTEAE